jgi:hypothetical protein
MSALIPIERNSKFGVIVVVHVFLKSASFVNPY